ncbi:hypothetical protein [Chryseolinea soli]|nr:hypothetical protein [Chryseolinea soli]
MTDEFNTQKNRLHASLYPFIQLLEYKHETLSVAAWGNFVSMTRESVINNPEQYLDLENIDSRFFRRAVDEIFDEILHPGNVEI